MLQTIYLLSGENFFRKRLITTTLKKLQRKNTTITSQIGCPAMKCRYQTLPEAFISNKIFTTPCLMTQEKLTDENGVTVIHNFEYNDKGIVTQKETVIVTEIMCI